MTMIVLAVATSYQYFFQFFFTMLVILGHHFITILYQFAILLWVLPTSILVFYKYLYLLL